MLWSAAGLADNEAANDDLASIPAVTLSVAAILADSRYPSRWQPHFSHDAMDYADHWSQPAASADLREVIGLSRVHKVRSVSLMTFAEIGQARLFFGVNRKGIVGLHFDVFARRKGAGNMEMLRMPYLKRAGSKAD
ncbi:MAG: hypothetical protein WBM54_00285 [Woeseia sp.]